MSRDHFEPGFVLRLIVHTERTEVLNPGLSLGSTASKNVNWGERVQRSRATSEPATSMATFSPSTRNASFASVVVRKRSVGIVWVGECQALHPWPEHSVYQLQLSKQPFK